MELKPSNVRLLRHQAPNQTMPSIVPVPLTHCRKCSARQLNFRCLILVFDPIAPLKLEQASSAKPAAKKRSQFRVASKNIAALYETVELLEIEAWKGVFTKAKLCPLCAGSGLESAFYSADRCDARDAGRRLVFTRRISTRLGECRSSRAWGCSIKWVLTPEVLSPCRDGRLAGGLAGNRINNCSASSQSSWARPCGRPCLR